MYKLPQWILSDIKIQLKLSNSMLDASHKGAKLSPKEVKEVLKSNRKIISLLEDNYYV